MSKLSRHTVHNLNSTGAPQNITAAGNIVSKRVFCRGAKCVTFYVYSTTDADTFAAANAFTMQYTIGRNSAAITGTPAYLTAAAFASLNGSVGTTGGAMQVYPLGGFGRIPNFSLGVTVTAGAAAVDNVVIEAVIDWE